MICLLLLPSTTLAIKIDSFTLDLQSNNDGQVTIAYHLSDREQAILNTQSAATIGIANSKLGLQTNGTGTCSVTSSNMTQWIEDNGTRTLLLFGFFFDQYDWRKNKQAVSEYPVLGLLTPDFKPSKVIINWPDGRSSEFQNVTYIPNLAITVNGSSST